MKKSPTRNQDYIWLSRCFEKFLENGTYSGRWKKISLRSVLVSGSTNGESQKSNAHTPKSVCNGDRQRYRLSHLIWIYRAGHAIPGLEMSQHRHRRPTKLPDHLLTLNIIKYQPETSEQRWRHSLILFLDCISTARYVPLNIASKELPG